MQLLFSLLLVINFVIRVLLLKGFMRIICEKGIFLCFKNCWMVFCKMLQKGRFINYCCLNCVNILLFELVCIISLSVKKNVRIMDSVRKFRNQFGSFFEKGISVWIGEIRFVMKLIRIWIRKKKRVRGNIIISFFIKVVVKNWCRWLKICMNWWDCLCIFLEGFIICYMFVWYCCL